MLGHVEKEQGEAWLEAVFEDPKTNEAAEKKVTESKSEAKRRVQKQKIKAHLMD